MERFHEVAPTHKALSGSLDATLSYVQGNALTPTPVAVQPPDLFQLAPAPGAPTRTIPILKPLADYDGFAVHVWGSDKDPDQESDPFYAKLIEEGADGFFTQVPSQLHQYLCENGFPRPDGSPRCAQQICPEGQTGIAPDCAVVVVDKKSKLSRIKVVAKGKIKAGKKKKVTIKVSATPGLGAGKVTVRIKSSNRKVKIPASIKVKLKPGATVKKTVKIEAKSKAKGKVKITATSGGKGGSAKLKVKR